MAWIVRLVKTGPDGEKQSIDVATINRPDDLVEIAHLGLTLAEGKLLLAGLYRSGLGALETHRSDCRSTRPPKDRRRSRPPKPTL